jgi:hypothetical protein
MHNAHPMRHHENREIGGIDVDGLMGSSATRRPMSERLYRASRHLLARVGAGAILDNPGHGWPQWRDRPQGAAPESSWTRRPCNNFESLKSGC